MGSQSKKKTFSFSLSDDEAAEVIKLAAEAGFDRNEWILAIMEAHTALDLRPRLDANNRRILRPAYWTPELKVAETPTDLTVPEVVDQLIKLHTPPEDYPERNRKNKRTGRGAGVSKQNAGRVS